MADSKVWIMTDSNSGITPEEGARRGIGVIPMPFFVDDQEYYENVTITREEFFKALADGKNVSTSQPSIAYLMDAFEEALKTYDEIVYIPMSGGLSASVMTAAGLAQQYDGRVQVVNNYRISVTQKQSVLEAQTLAAKGYSAAQIRELLERDALNASIYIAVDTLEYLKKGGRVTPAGAAIATILSLKPVLQIQGDKLDAYAKVRGLKAAQETMLKAIEQDMQTRFAGKKLLIKGAYTGDPALEEPWKQLLQSRFPDYAIDVDPLALSISCHIGPGATAVVVMEQLPEADDTVFEM